MLEVEVAACSEVGERRHNEDDLRHGNVGSVWYAVLSDGAGGHRGGAIASDIVVRMTAHGLQSATQLDPAVLTELVCETNAALSEQQQGKQGHDRMHATMVALWIDIRSEQALWTHVGDSRLYMLRHGRVRHVTTDDSVVQRMVHAGYLTAAEARDHPRKNQLIGAMGASETVDPNTLEAAFTVADGDAFLLCSDGWWEHFEIADIEASFANATSPRHWLELMAERVRREASPSQDNYSAIGVWIGDPAEITRVGDF
jgi:PPM family protein phosphatase